MADNRKVVKIKEDNLGEVHVADEVVAIIAGLAATEVEGVASMAGNITNELVSKLGMKNLSKGVKVEVARHSDSFSQSESEIRLQHYGDFWKSTGESKICN